MTDHRLVRADRDAVQLSGEHGAERQVFHLVIFWGACAVRIDVVDRFDPGITKAPEIAPIIAVPSGFERVLW